MVYLLGTITLILLVILAWTLGVAITVLATSQAAIGQYLLNLGEARRQRLIAHLELGYNAVVRIFGVQGITRTFVKVLLFYSVLMPPLAIFVIPVALNAQIDSTLAARIERQWMQLVAFEIWLWSNVLCDTVSFVATRNIVRRLLDQLKNAPGGVSAVGPAVGKSVLVAGVCLVVAAYATAVAYVLELKPDDWLAEFQKFRPGYVFDLMVADFAVLGHSLPFPPHLAVTATSYVLIVFLLISFSALALVTRLLGLPLIKRIGNSVVKGETTKAHILVVLAMVGGVCTAAWTAL